MFAERASQDTLDWFFNWYDDLHGTYQNKVDDLADRLGYPYYEDCTEDQLIDLHDRMEDTFQYDVKGSCVKASWDPTEADLYIVKIWHEIEANAEDTYGPEAAEEIFEIVARSPQDAIEQAKRSWDGPIDRIEIVDINPEDNGELNDEELYPFNSSRKVSASFDSSTSRNLSQLSFDFVHDGYYSIDDMEVIVSAALEENGCEYQASQFESVDYSSYPEYADFNISQMSVDFTWSDDYNADAITDSISRRLSSINYALIGIDFRSID